MLPRPVRNNNPGDMILGPPWRGLLPWNEQNEAQRSEPRFCVFVDPQHGFRAIAKQLWTYHYVHGCNTVAEYITRWAPPIENRTRDYIATVAKALGVKDDAPIDLTNPSTIFGIVKAITTVETGSWHPYWNDQELTEGLALP